MVDGVESGRKIKEAKRQQFFKDVKLTLKSFLIQRYE